MDDKALDQLLDLDGISMTLSSGYRVTFSARRVPTTIDRPHGLNYSLCLLDPDDRRVLCYDNAHPIATGSGPARRTTETRDHVHKGPRITHYPYVNAQGLLLDFWNDVWAILGSRGAE